MRRVFVGLFLVLPTYAWAGLDLAKFCTLNPVECSLQVKCSNGFKIAMRNPRTVATDRAIVQQPGGEPYETSIHVTYSNGVQISGIFHPYCQQSLIQEAAWNNWALVQICEGMPRSTVPCYSI